MKENRIELHEKLCSVIGSRKVYFQPPESMKLEYPCIIYSKSDGQSLYADNVHYLYMDSYEVTYIGKDPDTEVPYKLLSSFTMIRKDRRFVSDNLYHDVFTLFY